MKNKIFMLLFFLSVSISAQDFYGKATYKTHRKMDFKLDSTEAATNPGLQSQIEAQMKKMFQKTFVLNFNRSESTYKEDVKLNAPRPQIGGGNVMVQVVGGGGGNDVLYKNIKEKKMVNKTDLMGKIFLIKDDLVEYDWKLTGETKNIGKYTCYKATYEREVENIEMKMVNGEPEEVTKKEMRTTTAWYTTDVPVSNGPGNYTGLPGLILEVNDGDLTIVCTEIVLNPSEKPSIKAPEKGKVVTRDKFEKISRKKSKEMMERFRSRRGDGNQMEIRIGG
ncbi:GLPGLI family protein [Pseudotenacibaculum haliotis]|uniref:GLPGLI family protein n=1 Tax=Pseudotenacibaculum haliotis TaxID=1862138 RepID=A0ABW5LXF0_9FLAO